MLPRSDEQEGIDVYRDDQQFLQIRGQALAEKKKDLL